jgi:hypothetical protein
LQITFVATGHGDGALLAIRPAIGPAAQAKREIAAGGRAETLLPQAPPDPDQIGRSLIKIICHCHSAEV